MKNQRKMKKNKHAQMKIQEMSFMLLGLVLFFIIAGLFFIIFSGSSLKKSQAQLSEAEAIASISSLVNSPELSCGEALCVDADKLLALKLSPEFSDYWQMDGLVIKKIYPYSEEEMECGAGNYEICNRFTLKEPSGGFLELSSYVNICKKDLQRGYSYDKCELGVISAYVAKD